MGAGVRAHDVKVKHRRHKADGCAADDASLAEAYMYGDVLESVVLHVPASDLAAAPRVSREWLRAVRAALRRRPRRLPWLVVHLQQGRGGARRTTTAYDPNSGAWMTAPAPPRHATPSHVRLVRGARGDRVCALSLSGLAVAGDPLGAAAASVALAAPAVWRVDPVLAAVGGRVVALGGACRLALAEGEDAAAVEVHEEGTGWAACEPMPGALREHAAATWLSAAATDRRVYLVERTAGWASWFDPASRRWGPTRRLGLDTAVSAWGVSPGRAGAGPDERLVLFGAKRADKEAAECAVVVQAWELDGDTLEPIPSPSTDAMPSDLSEKLFPRDEDEEEEDDDWDDTSLSLGVCGNSAGGYVYNAAEPSNGAVLYELQEGKADGTATAVARWEWVPCAPAVKAEPLGRAILACLPVGLDDVSMGIGSAGPSRACAAAH